MRVRQSAKPWAWHPTLGVLQLFGPLCTAGRIVVARRSNRTVIIRAAARSATLARLCVSGALLGKFRQLVAIQFAITVGVEMHRVCDHPLCEW
jgi:hypothetical protein